MSDQGRDEIPWGLGAKSLHGVQAPYEFLCCGKVTRSYAYAFIMPSGEELCEACARGRLEGVEQPRLAL